MHRISLVAASMALALSACSGEPSEEERAAQAREDAAAIEAVEAAQTPPPQPLNLSAITFPDIERENLFGTGCNFAPAGGGMGAIAIAQGEAGYLKVDNRVERFAPDTGSTELPYGTRERYTSTSRSFRLIVDTSEAQQSGYETMDYRGRLLIRDSRDRVVYEADGIVQCGS